MCLHHLLYQCLFLKGVYLQKTVSKNIQVQIPIEKLAPRKVYEIDSTLSLFLPESLLLEREFRRRPRFTSPSLGVVIVWRSQDLENPL